MFIDNGRTLDFGSKMRRAREARGITRAQIAAATKISPGALEALERNDISRLPGGIFSRALVRSYAVQVGLDPEQTIREFIAQFPDASVTAGSPHVPAEDHVAIASQRESAATVLWLIAISVPLAAAILYFGRGVSAPTSAPGAGEGDAAVVGATAHPAVLAPLVVELFAIAPVRVEVEIDGAQHETREVPLGERLTFSADREMRLAMTDAGAVQLTINGQLGLPLGASGEPGTAHIGRDNYRAFLASQ